MDEQAGTREMGSSAAQAQAHLEHMLALDEVPLFRSLNRRHLRRVARLVHVKRYRDCVVARAGSRGDAFYVILEGRADVTVSGGSVRALEAGECFGELALLDGAPRAATVTAVGELTAARVARSDFSRLIADEPGVTLGLITGLVAMIRAMQPEHVEQPGSVGVPDLPDSARPSVAADLAERTSLGWLSALSQVPLFCETRTRNLGRVIQLAQLRRYTAGTAVVRAGTLGDAFHIVLDGRARVETPAGHAHVLHVGDSFGELALLDGRPRAATVVAVDDLTTARIARPAFLKLVRGDPAIAAGILRGLVRIVRDLEAGRPTDERRD
jgi:CRP-like cAMP-binding protein